MTPHYICGVIFSNYIFSAITLLIAYLCCTLDRNKGSNITEYREIPRNCGFVKTLFPRYCVHKRYAMAGKGIYVIHKRRTFSTKNMY